MKKFLLLFAALICPLFAGCAGQEIRVDTDKAYRDALTVFRQSGDDESPAVRALTMELAPQALGKRAGAICKQALSDESPEVRFAAAMGLGKIRYVPAKGKLQKMAGYTDRRRRA